MPHKVDEQELQDQAEERLLQSILDGTAETGQLPEGLVDLDRDLEVGEKADDAQDFEDISDDDLPDDEDAVTSALPPTATEELTDSAAPGDGPAPDDGFEDDFNFDFGDDGDDLFGDDELPADQVQEGHTAAHLGSAVKDGTATSLPPPTLSGGLALPTKRPHLPGDSSLKSPSHALDSDSPMSDAKDDQHQETDLDEDDEEEEEDERAIQQRRLFEQMRQEREDRERRGYEAPQEADLETFYNIWPTFDPEERPRFTTLFPQRRAVYSWKTPIKPPKIVQPTKVNLELLPDQERSFRLPITASGRDNLMEQNGNILIAHPAGEQEDSDDNIDLDDIDETEIVGGVSWQDFNLVCEDWDLPSLSSDSDVDVAADFDVEGPPHKKRRLSDGHFDLKQAIAFSHHFPSLENPEKATSRVAKHVQLDMNDPALLLDEHAPPTQPKKLRGLAGDMGREAKSAAARDMTRRYNISNDEAYELLKENHQSKVRATLGSMAVEHSLPAIKLQYPFYRVALDETQKRFFHRPTFTTERHDRSFTFSKVKRMKRKELKGKEANVVFAKAEDLSMADNSNALLLEYSEEQPVMLSNFGMGNRLINYYRKKDETDASRPKLELGETHLLHLVDRSPFANFGQVDPGEVVPSIHNGLYRAPIFKHEPKPTDFLIITNVSNAGGGRKWFMRNIENIHTVGQQFPSVEVPGEHSRKVTDAAKKRLWALSYRIHKKYLDNRGPPLTNEVVKNHLPGSDVAQNRGKMREFMHYDKNNSLWELKQGHPFPANEVMRDWVKPEDICMLDSMQVGVQHLKDLGLKGEDEDNKKGDDEAKEEDNIEILLAPWNTTKNFMHATQGKAMLQLHGEGDPTARGEGFSFIKTSMKGGFRALGESVADRIDAKKLKENGGHSYNVARQQKAYDESIRRIWRAQHESLSSAMEASDQDDDMEDEPETARSGPGETPRSSFGTPAFSRRDDETMSQFSKFSANQSNKVLYIERTVTDVNGVTKVETQRVTNPRVIAAYKKHKEKEALHDATLSHHGIPNTGNSEQNNLAIKRYAQSNRNIGDGQGLNALLALTPAQQVISDQMRSAQDELDRLKRNRDRRRARMRAKGRDVTPDSTGSPAVDGDENGENGSSAPTTTTTGKGKRSKKNTEGTARKCANCGQVGHIKTNKKSVSTTFPCDCKNHTTPKKKETASGGVPKSSSNSKPSWRQKKKEKEALALSLAAAAEAARPPGAPSLAEASNWLFNTPDQSWK